MLVRSIHRRSCRHTIRFYFSGDQNETLIARTKETYDGALPSGNSILTYAMARLSVLAPGTVPDAALQKQLSFMKTEASALPTGFAMLMLALSDLDESPMKLVAVGAESEKTKIPLSVPIGANIILLENETEEYKRKEGKSTFYVCRGHSCLPPVHELGTIR